MLHIPKDSIDNMYKHSIKLDNEIKRFCLNIFNTKNNIYKRNGIKLVISNIASTFIHYRTLFCRPIGNRSGG